MKEDLPDTDVSLRLLEIFGAMMRCETTVEAAEQLGISQPAVSNGIRQLESQLGVTLFERLHRRLQPTEEALQLYEEVRPVFGLLRSFSNRARSIRQGLSGRLRIIATPPLGHTVAPLALKHFLSTRPDVMVSYDVRRLEHVVEAVQNGTADLGLGLALDRKNPSVNVEHLAAGHLVALVPKDLPLARENSISPRNLTSGTFIGLEAESRIGQMLRQAFEGDEAIYDPRVEVRYCSTATVLAGAGLGIAVVDPYSAVTRDADKIALLPFQPPVEISACLITRKGVPRSRLLHAFIADLKRTMSEAKNFAP
ncbi:LysR family transcriptional regulator [Rhizobium sp. PAMB 3174]